MSGNRQLWQRRVVAALLDAVPVFLIVQGILAVFGYGVVFLHSGPSVGYLRLRLIETVAIAAYYPWIMTITDGRTLGKQVMGIRVVRTDQKRMGVSRAVWREVLVKSILFGTLATAAGIAGALGVIVVLADALWPLRDKESRALHDMVARTRVVDVRVLAV